MSISRRLNRIASRTVLLLVAVLTGSALASGPAGARSSHAVPASFAFYYGTDIPWESLGAFDVAVVEPDNVGPTGWAHRLNPDTTVAAYISVGEMHPTREYFKDLRPEWKLGENNAWGSTVIDQAGPGWSSFYIERIIKPLWERGYRAFFLDTLDSFTLVAKTPASQKRQIAGLVALIQDIKRAYPDAKLIFNRGFEILPEVHALAYAVAAESLFQGWDAVKQAFSPVSATDREWILGKLQTCQTEYRLPVISIDYVPPESRALANETAQKIKALGIIPWVTNPTVDMVGVGQVEVLPRQVLIVHDEPGDLADVATHEAHQSGSLPLNYLGFDVRYVFHGSAELRGLSMQVLSRRFAGVVTWFNRDSFPETAAMVRLLKNAKAQGVPVVMMNQLPGDATMLDWGVLSAPPVKLSQLPTIDRRVPEIGFEIEPETLQDALVPITVHAASSDVWLRWKAGGDTRAGETSNLTSDVIAITPWGGFAAGRSFNTQLPQDFGSRWVVNPIEFFRATLQVDSAIPVPDVTTESGRRMLLIHVDGDGFPSRTERIGSPLAGEVLLSEFLLRYRWPSTISIIEGEVGPDGLHAALSSAMEKTARQIFSLPHIEMASHTYSHPFFWKDAELGKETPGRVVRLRIPGYSYSSEREIMGARDYINTLAPSGKKTRVLLWSGDTEPLEKPIRLAYEAGLLNMNGGFTTTSQAEPSLTLVAPLGMMKGDFYQVYAPMQNEHVYTNGWTGPFYGFERVIETFERTERPLRLKPINIYYHTYITTKRAGITSLHKVYGWAERQLGAQRLHPVYASQYIERVLDWRRATVARSDEGWELRGGHHLRQWRVDAAAPLPVFAAAAGLAGYARHATVNFIHAAKSIARWSSRSVTPVGINSLFLESANARLVSWLTHGGSAGSATPSPITHTFVFDGNLPLQAHFLAPADCEMAATSGLKSIRQAASLYIESPANGATTVTLRCTR